MAIYTNQATLSYNNVVVNSNIATGEILEVLNIQKSALNSFYDNNSIITQNTCKLYIHYIIVLLKLDRYILCSQRWRSSIPSVETRPGADCNSDHEFFFFSIYLFILIGG
jgi:hypothetical protein